MDNVHVEYRMVSEVIYAQVCHKKGPVNPSMVNYRGWGGGGEGSGRDRGEEREANSLHWRLGMSFSVIHRHNKKENQNPQPAPSVASTNVDYQKSHQTCMLTLQTL